MNEEIEESEFYQEDFTTASDWEIFISRLEEIINHWKIDDLKEESHEGCIWVTKSEKLTFVDVEFELFYYKKLEALESSETECQSEKPEKYKIENSVDIKYDFPLLGESLCHTHSCIFTWYGLKTYFVLSTTGDTEINSESKIKILVSSLTIVLSNLNCHIPAFVQIREKWQKLYLGVHQNEQFRTNFSMVHLKRIPNDCRYLTNLVDLFTFKLNISSTTSSVSSSVQFTYNLTDFGKSVWKQDIFSMECDHLDAKSLYRLPFGITKDPIDVLKLKATWFKSRDRDSDYNSQYQAIYATQWSILVEDVDSTISLLCDCLNDYSYSLVINSTIQDILTELSLDKLVETKVSTISSILGRAARNSLSGTQKVTSAISENILVAILYYLFPDADTRQSEPSYPYHEKEEKNHDSLGVSVLH